MGTNPAGSSKVGPVGSDLPSLGSGLWNRMVRLFFPPRLPVPSPPSSEELALRARWSSVGSIYTHFAHVPTMLTGEELQMLYWLTSQEYTGQGTIVDCGPFLGGSTSALCAGLRDNSHKAGGDGIVHVYDRFTYDTYFDTWFAQLGVNLKEGETFLPVYENLNAQYLDLLSIHAADMLISTYDYGPIEVLFIDICKSWEINARVVQQFFRHLIPGKSLIVQQDYVHFYAFWLVLTMDYFRDYFERLGQVGDGHSALFRCVKPIPEEMLTTDLRTLPLKQKCEAFHRELRRCQGWQRTEILVAYCRMLMEAGDESAARAIARSIDPQAAQHPINKVAMTFVPPEYLAAA